MVCIRYTVQIQHGLEQKATVTYRIDQAIKVLDAVPLSWLSVLLSELLFLPLYFGRVNSITYDFQLR